MTTVSIYRNLHKDCWSLGEAGQPVEHAQEVYVDGPVRFVVQPAGNAKVRRERRKTVHAFVRYTDEDVNEVGTRLTLTDLAWSNWVQVTYNPYKYTTFVRVDNELPVVKAEAVVMLSNGKVYAKNPRPVT